MIRSKHLLTALPLLVAGCATLPPPPEPEPHAEAYLLQAFYYASTSPEDGSSATAFFHDRTYPPVELLRLALKEGSPVVADTLPAEADLEELSEGLTQPTHFARVEAELDLTDEGVALLNASVCHMQLHGMEEYTIGAMYYPYPPDPIPPPKKARMPYYQKHAMAHERLECHPGQWIVLGEWDYTGIREYLLIRLIAPAALDTPPARADAPVLRAPPPKKVARPAALNR